jgi:hypothetical protein
MMVNFNAHGVEWDLFWELRFAGVIWVHRFLGEYHITILSTISIANQLELATALP